MLKKTLLFMLLLGCMTFLIAQVPQGFSYQAVLRDAQGAILANQNVAIRLNVLPGAPPAVAVYQENHSTTTNEFGLITLAVGQGMPVSGTFSSIDWSTGTYFLEVEVDQNGGSTFTNLGSFQLLTVPFAMYANATANVEDADADPMNEIQTLTKVGDTITLSNGGGAIVDNNVDADADSTNELQTLTINGNVLSLTGGGRVTLPMGSGSSGSSPWDTVANGVTYTHGFVGIDVANPEFKFQVLDTLGTGGETTISSATHIDPGTTGFVVAAESFLDGQSTNDTTASYTALQGAVEVNNVGGGPTTNRGLAGFADSAFNNTGVFAQAGSDGDTTSGFNIGLVTLGESSTFINRGVEAIASGSGQFNQGIISFAANPSNGINTGLYGLAAGSTTRNFGLETLVTPSGSEFNIGILTSVNFGSTGNNFGLYAIAPVAANSTAGFFDGNVDIQGNLSKTGGTFKIDHPLDPANQYLIHSFVESPDMLNIYNGNITTDGNGYATVELPTYFEAANKDFKYQLTVIGTFAQAIIAEKLSNNRFVIQTNQPNVEVSWQITGVRADPWAEANRIVPEVPKTGQAAGRYLYPSLYDQPASKGMPKPTRSAEAYQRSISPQPDALTNPDR